MDQGRRLADVEVAASLLAGLVTVLLLGIAIGLVMVSRIQSQSSKPHGVDSAALLDDGCELDSLGGDEGSNSSDSPAELAAGHVHDDCG